MKLPLNRFFRPLLARDRHESHRAATQLELLFDLVIVIAIAASAHGLAHEITAGRPIMGIIKFMMALALESVHLVCQQLRQ